MDEDNPTTIIRHGQLWFSDGNIVLSTEMDPEPEKSSKISASTPKAPRWHDLDSEDEERPSSEDGDVDFDVVEGTETYNLDLDPHFQLDFESKSPGSSSSTEKKVLLFRVHKSLLSQYSSVFAEMFQMGNNSGMESSSEKYEGVPLISMNDSSRDITRMLEAIYFPLCVI